jgi:UDP-glucose 4-epimerase
VAASSGDVRGIFNLGGGSRVSLSQAIQAIEEVCGQELSVEYTAHEVGDVTDTWADLTRAETELGYMPRVSLRKGLEDECSWMSRIVSAEAHVAENALNRGTAV